MSNRKSLEMLKKELNGCKVHPVVIQKGGVGKSTLTSDICYTLAKKGFKVLAIDTDPQASLSSLCNVDIEDESVLGLQDIYEALDEMVSGGKKVSYEDLKKVWFEDDGNGGNKKAPTYTKPVKDGNRLINKHVPFGFDLIPANINLADWDLRLAQSQGGMLLSALIGMIKKNENYDFIIMDNPPGLNALSYNSIAAGTDGCIIPINLEPMTIRGAQNLINTTTEIQNILWFETANGEFTDRVKKHAVCHKGILGVIKNQYAPRLKIQKRFEDVVKKFFPIPCFETTIPNKTVCDTAHDLGRLYSEYDSKVGKVFDALVDEIIAEDIRRSSETEPIFIESFGEEIWEEINANKEGGDLDEQ